MAISMKQANDRLYNVKHEGRLIGFIILMPIRGQIGWLFIANRKDIACRMTPVASVFQTAEECLACVAQRLGC